MSDASWLAQAQAFNKTRSDIVELTVPAPLGGTETFRWCSRAGPDVGKRTGENIIATLLSVSGASAKIDDKLFTNRAQRTVKFVEQQNFTAFDAAKTSVTGGSTFWRTFIVAFPQWFNAEIKILSWFDHSTITALSQAETMFRGRLRDIKFKPNNRVWLEIEDNTAYRNAKVPSPISDENVLTANETAASALIDVTDKGEFTDPAEWDSVDWLPPSIQINDEIIIYEGLDPTNQQLIVGANRINDSDDITQWTWRGVTLLGVTIGPHGELDGYLLRMLHLATIENTSPTYAAASNPANAALFLREHPNDPGVSLTLRVSGTGGTPENGDVAAVVEDQWKRFDVGKTFTGAATGNATITLLNNTGSPQRVFVAKGDVQPATTKTVHVSTDATSEGNDAGRGAYGTTAASHTLGDAVTELAVYRRQLFEDEGLHPITCQRDLLNRMFVEEADVDEDSFQSEIDFCGINQFRRTVSDPRSGMELLKEVRESAISDIWAADSGLVTTRYPWRPPLPGETLQEIDETSDILSKSQEWTTNKKSRITRVFVYFDLKDIGGEPADGSKPEDFNQVLVVFDPSAEQPNGKAERSLFIFSRWIFRRTEAVAVGRLIGRFRLGAKSGELKMTFKRYDDIKTGDQIVVKTSKVLKDDGTATAAQADATFQVMESSFTRTGNPIRLTVLEAVRKRYGFIGPNSLPNDYDLATDAQREYAFIANNASPPTVGTAGDEAYHII